MFDLETYDSVALSQVQKLGRDSALRVIGPWTRACVLALVLAIIALIGFSPSIAYALLCLNLMVLSCLTLSRLASSIEYCRDDREVVAPQQCVELPSCGRRSHHV